MKLTKQQLGKIIKEEVGEELEAWQRDPRRMANFAMHIRDEGEKGIESMVSRMTVRYNRLLKGKPVRGTAMDPTRTDFEGILESIIIYDGMDGIEFDITLEGDGTTLGSVWDLYLVGTEAGEGI